MPMYEYKCTACGHTFEKYEAGRSAGVATGGSCPQCGTARTKRQFSTFASSCCGTEAPKTTSGGGCGSSHFT